MIKAKGGKNDNNHQEWHGGDADLTYKADVAVDGGKITEIGPNLKGDKELDATGCYVMPGGIDPHVHLEMPFMGTYSTDDFESGHAQDWQAAPRWC